MPATGFDHIAEEYDEQFSRTAIGRLQRALVHDFLSRMPLAGAAVLDLNCGTGEDALWLAGLGCRVTATDISTDMVRRTAGKVRQAGMDHLVQSRVLDIRTLANTPTTPSFPTASFDLILSDFGGLNCLSKAELRAIAPALTALLRPGGRFVAVVMGRFCWWETLYFLLKGHFRAAVRRFTGGPVPAALSPGISVPTWYYGPGEFRRCFPELTALAVHPIGIWLPPSYLGPRFSKREIRLNRLNRLEKKCRNSVWAIAADHFLIALQKK